MSILGVALPSAARPKMSVRLRVGDRRAWSTPSRPTFLSQREEYFQSGVPIDSRTTKPDDTGRKELRSNSLISISSHRDQSLQKPILFLGKSHKDTELLNTTTGSHVFLGQETARTQGSILKK